MTMPWRRVLAAALALTAVVGGVLVAGAAQAQAVTTGTLTISGDSNDSITMGKSYSYSISKGAVLDVSSEDGSKVRISVTTPNGGQWHLDFSSPDQPAAGRSPVLVPGTYTVAQYPDYSRTSPKLDVWGGSGCAFGVTGSFAIKKAIFGPQGYVQAFDATFVQHCDGATPAARGEVNISNPPPSRPPPPPPSPSSTTASPSTTASTYAVPTVRSPATGTGRGTALAGGGAAGAPPTTTVWTDTDRARFMMIGLGVIAVVILVANVVIGVRSRRMRQAYLSPERRPAGPAAMGGAVMGPWSTDNSVEHRWLPYDPSPPAARRSLPGKVIAVSVVLAARGALGLLLTVATIAALHLNAVQELPLPSWYANVLWLQAATCAGEVVSGLLLLRGKEWPRMLGLSVLWFDVAAGTLIMLTTTFSCAGLFGIAVDAVLIWMLFWAEVRDWCY